MSMTAGRARACVVAAVFAVALVAAPVATTGAGAVPSPGGPRCTTLPLANDTGLTHRPGVTVTNRQDGETICIAVGQVLSVFLSAPTLTTTPWSAVRLSKPGVLKALPITFMVRRGATAANFLAVGKGAVDLSSYRPACPPPPAGAATCEAVQLWRVSVVVGTAGVATGAYGVVTAGPTCPVESAAHPCLPRPVAGATVEARGTGGGVAGTTRTDGKGSYALALPTGNYQLIVVTGSVLPRCPAVTVAVPKVGRARVNVSCDTGIR
jgi:hypothetical protein